MKKIISTILVITFAWEQIVYAGGDFAFSWLRPAATVESGYEKILTDLQDPVNFASPLILYGLLEAIEKRLNAGSISIEILEKTADALRELLEQTLEPSLHTKVSELNGRIQKLIDSTKETPLDYFIKGGFETPLKLLEERYLLDSQREYISGFCLWLKDRYLYTRKLTESVYVEKLKKPDFKGPPLAKLRKKAIPPFARIVDEILKAKQYARLDKLVNRTFNDLTRHGLDAKPLCLEKVLTIALGLFVYATESNQYQGDSNLLWARLIEILKRLGAFYKDKGGYKEATGYFKMVQQLRQIHPISKKPKASIKPTGLRPEYKKYEKAFYKDEPIAKYYFKKICELNLQLIGLAVRRKTLKEEKQKAEAAQRRQQTLKSEIEIQRLEAELEASVIELYDIADRTSEIAEEIPQSTYPKHIPKGLDRRKEAADELINAAKHTRGQNEPAANACIVAAINRFADEMFSLLGERLSRAKEKKRFRFNRETGKYELIQGQRLLYRIGPEQEISFNVPIPKEFKLTWEAFRGVDDQIDNQLDEQKLLKGYIEMLDALSAGLEDATYEILQQYREALAKMLLRLEKAIVEEKEIAAIGLDVVDKQLLLLQLYFEERNINSAKAVIAVVRRMLDTRIRILTDMITGTREGRLSALRKEIEQRNAEIIGRAEKIIGVLRIGDFTSASGKVWGFLRNERVKRYLREPEFTGMQGLLGGLKDAILRRSRDEAIRIAQLIVKKGKDAKHLAEFISKHRDLYVDSNIGAKEGLTKEEIFEQIFESYIKKAQLIRGSPLSRVRKARLFWARCYQAAFIPLNIKNPEKKKERIPNPTFLAVSKFILLQEVNDLKRALKYTEEDIKTHSLIEGLVKKGRNNFDELSEKERESLVEALYQDYKEKPGGVDMKSLYEACTAPVSDSFAKFFRDLLGQLNSIEIGIAFIAAAAFTIFLACRKVYYVYKLKNLLLQLNKKLMFLNGRLGTLRQLGLSDKEHVEYSNRIDKITDEIEKLKTKRRIRVKKADLRYAEDISQRIEKFIKELEKREPLLEKIAVAKAQLKSIRERLIGFKERLVIIRQREGNTTRLKEYWSSLQAMSTTVEFLTQNPQRLLERDYIGELQDGMDSLSRDTAAYENEIAKKPSEPKVEKPKKPEPEKPKPIKDKPIPFDVSADPEKEPFKVLGLPETATLKEVRERTVFLVSRIYPESKYPQICENIEKALGRAEEIVRKREKRKTGADKEPLVQTKFSELDKLAQEYKALCDRINSRLDKRVSSIFNHYYLSGAGIELDEHQEFYKPAYITRGYDSFRSEALGTSKKVDEKRLNKFERDFRKLRDNLQRLDAIGKDAAVIIQLYSPNPFEALGVVGKRTMEAVEKAFAGLVKLKYFRHEEALAEEQQWRQDNFIKLGDVHKAALEELRRKKSSYPDSGPFVVGMLSFLNPALWKCFGIGLVDGAGFFDRLFGKKGKGEEEAKRVQSTILDTPEASLARIDRAIQKFSKDTETLLKQVSVRITAGPIKSALDEFGKKSPEEKYAACRIIENALYREDPTITIYKSGMLAGGSLYSTLQMTHLEAERKTARHVLSEFLNIITNVIPRIIRRSDNLSELIYNLEEEAAKPDDENPFIIYYQSQRIIGFESYFSNEKCNVWRKQNKLPEKAEKKKEEKKQRPVELPTIKTGVQPEKPKKPEPQPSKTPTPIPFAVSGIPIDFAAEPTEKEETLSITPELIAGLSVEAIGRLPYSNATKKALIAIKDRVNKGAEVTDAGIIAIAKQYNAPLDEITRLFKILPPSAEEPEPKPPVKETAPIPQLPEEAIPTEITPDKLKGMSIKDIMALPFPDEIKGALAMLKTEVLAKGRTITDEDIKDIADMCEINPADIYMIIRPGHGMPNWQPIQSELPAILTDSNKKEGNLRDVYARDTVQCRTTQELPVLLCLKLLMQSSQFFSVGSFGQIRIAPIKERIIVSKLSHFLEFINDIMKGPKLVPAEMPPALPVLLREDRGRGPVSEPPAPKSSPAQTPGLPSSPAKTSPAGTSSADSYFESLWNYLSLKNKLKARIKEYDDYIAPLSEKGKTVLDEARKVLNTRFPRRSKVKEQIEILDEPSFDWFVKLFEKVGEEERGLLGKVNHIDITWGCSHLCDYCFANQTAEVHTLPYVWAKELEGLIEENKRKGLGAPGLSNPLRDCQDRIFRKNYADYIEIFPVDHIDTSGFEPGSVAEEAALKIKKEHPEVTFTICINVVNKWIRDLVKKYGLKKGVRKFIKYEQHSARILFGDDYKEEAVPHTEKDSKGRIKHNYYGTMRKEDGIDAIEVVHQITGVSKEDISRSVTSTYVGRFTRFDASKYIYVEPGGDEGKTPRYYMGDLIHILPNGDIVQGHFDHSATEYICLRKHPLSKPIITKDDGTIPKGVARYVEKPSAYPDWAEKIQPADYFCDLYETYEEKLGLYCSLEFWEGFLKPFMQIAHNPSLRILNEQQFAYAEYLSKLSISGADEEKPGLYDEFNKLCEKLGFSAATIFPVGLLSFADAETFASFIENIKAEYDFCLNKLKERPDNPRALEKKELYEKMFLLLQEYIYRMWDAGYILRSHYSFKKQAPSVLEKEAVDIFSVQVPAKMNRGFLSRIEQYKQAGAEAILKSKKSIQIRFWLASFLYSSSIFKYISRGYWREIYARKGLNLIVEFIKEFVNGGLKDNKETADALIEKYRVKIKDNDKKFWMIWLPRISALITFALIYLVAVAIHYASIYLMGPWGLAIGVPAIALLLIANALLMDAVTRSGAFFKYYELIANGRIELASVVGEKATESGILERFERAATLLKGEAEETAGHIIQKAPPGTAGPVGGTIIGPDGIKRLAAIVAETMRQEQDIAVWETFYILANRFKVFSFTVDNLLKLEEFKNSSLSAELLRNKLEEHLKVLEKLGLISKVENRYSRKKMHDNTVLVIAEVLRDYRDENDFERVKNKLEEVAYRVNASIEDVDKPIFGGVENVNTHEILALRFGNKSKGWVHILLEHGNMKKAIAAHRTGVYFPVNLSEDDIKHLIYLAAKFGTKIIIDDEGRYEWVLPEQLAKKAGVQVIRLGVSKNGDIITALPIKGKGIKIAPDGKVIDDQMLWWFFENSLTKDDIAPINIEWSKFRVLALEFYSDMNYSDRMERFEKLLRSAIMKGGIISRGANSVVIHYKVSEAFGHAEVKGRKYYKLNITLVKKPLYAAPKRQMFWIDNIEPTRENVTMGEWFIRQAKPGEAGPVGGASFDPDRMKDIAKLLKESPAFWKKDSLLTKIAEIMMAFDAYMEDLPLEEKVMLYLSLVEQCISSRKSYAELLPAFEKLKLLVKNELVTIGCITISGEINIMHQLKAEFEAVFENERNRKVFYTALRGLLPEIKEAFKPEFELGEYFDTTANHMFHRATLKSKSFGERDCIVKSVRSAELYPEPQTARLKDEFFKLMLLNPFGENAYFPYVFSLMRTEERGFSLVMEKIEGAPLAEFINSEAFRKNPMLLKEVLLNLCHAIDIIHKKGVAHRDLNPANIFVTEKGDVKILDFSIAVTKDYNWDDDILKLKNTGNENWAASVNLSDGNSYEGSLARDRYAFGKILSRILENIPSTQIPSNVRKGLEGISKDFVDSKGAYSPSIQNLMQRVYYLFGPRKAKGAPIDESSTTIRKTPPAKTSAAGTPQENIAKPEPLQSSKSVGRPDANAESPEGLCVTADTLLTLRDCSQISIVKIKPGDYVLSLNEDTQKIEPRRVRGLLDMGGKPVFRLTTASGRSIRTTANHPYLTKDGWVKVRDLKAGDEIAVPHTNLFSAVRIFASINAVDDDMRTLEIKTDTIFPDSEPVGSRGKIDEGLRKRERKTRRYEQLQLFANAVAQLWWEFLEFTLAARSKLNTLNSRLNQAIPNSCFIFSKGTKPSFFASSMPFLSFATICGFIGRRFSIASIIQPTGLLNTYSFAGTFSSYFASNAHNKSHNEYVSNIKYFGVPFLSVTTAPLKSSAKARPEVLSPFGIAANFSKDCSLTSSFTGSLINVLCFILSSPSLICKCSTQIPTMSRLFTPPDVEAAQGKNMSFASDILWDRIISIECLGYDRVYDIEVEGTHNFIGNGIFAHNTYMEVITAPPPQTTKSSPAQTGEKDLPKAPFTGNCMSMLIKIYETPELKENEFTLDDYVTYDKRTSRAVFWKYARQLTELGYLDSRIIAKDKTRILVLKITEKGKKKAEEILLGDALRYVSFAGEKGKFAVREGRVIWDFGKLVRPLMLKELYDRYGTFELYGLVVTEKGGLSIGRDQQFYFTQHKNKKVIAIIGQNGIATEIRISGEAEPIKLLLLFAGDELVASTVEYFEKDSGLLKLIAEYKRLKISGLKVAAQGPDKETDYGILRVCGKKYCITGYNGADAEAIIEENAVPTVLILKPMEGKEGKTIKLYKILKDGVLIDSYIGIPKETLIGIYERVAQLANNRSRHLPDSIAGRVGRFDVLGKTVNRKKGRLRIGGQSYGFKKYKGRETKILIGSGGNPLMVTFLADTHNEERTINLKCAVKNGVIIDTKVEYEPRTIRRLAAKYGAFEIIDFDSRAKTLIGQDGAVIRTQTFDTKEKYLLHDSENIEERIKLLRSFYGISPIPEEVENNLCQFFGSIDEDDEISTRLARKLVFGSYDKKESRDLQTNWAIIRILSKIKRPYISKYAALCVAQFNAYKPPMRQDLSMIREALRRFRENIGPKSSPAKTSAAGEGKNVNGVLFNLQNTNIITGFEILFWLLRVTAILTSSIKKTLIKFGVIPPSLRYKKKPAKEGFEDIREKILKQFQEIETGKRQKPVVLVISEPTAAGKTLTAESMEKGAFGLSKDEICVITHDEFASDDYFEKFRPVDLKKYYPGKKLIIIDGEWAFRYIPSVKIDFLIYLRSHFLTRLINEFKRTSLGFREERIKAKDNKMKLIYFWACQSLSYPLLFLVYVLSYIHYIFTNYYYDLITKSNIIIGADIKHRISPEDIIKIFKIGAESKPEILGEIWVLAKESIMDDAEWKRLKAMIDLNAEPDFKDMQVSEYNNGLTDLAKGHPLIYRTLLNSKNIAIFLQLLTDMRFGISPYVNGMKRKTPLEFITQEGGYFEIAPNLYVSPVTESFRGHLLFGTDNEGRITYIIKLKIPGQEEKEERAIIARENYDAAVDLCERYKGRIEIQKPKFCIEYRGEFILFGHRYITQKEPIRIMAFEYYDGRRPTRCGKSYIYEKAEEIGVPEGEVALQILNGILDFVNMAHEAGYVCGSDLHLDNFKLVFDKAKHKIRVVAVPDMGSYEKAGPLEKAQPLQAAEKAKIIVELMRLLFKEEFVKDDKLIAEFIKINKRAVELNPEDKHAWYNFGILYFMLKMYSEAAECVRNALRIDGTFYPANDILEECLRNIGQTTAEPAKNWDGSNSGLQPPAPKSSPGQTPEKTELPAILTDSNKKEGNLRGVYASGDTVQCRTTQELPLLLYLKLLMRSSQFFSVGSFGQIRIAPVKERIIVRTKIILHAIFALRNASEINKAITRAWNKFMSAFETRPLRLFVQNILVITIKRLSHFLEFVNDVMKGTKLVPAEMPPALPVLLTEDRGRGPVSEPPAPKSSPAKTSAAGTPQENIAKPEPSAISPRYYRRQEAAGYLRELLSAEEPLFISGGMVLGHLLEEELRKRQVTVAFPDLVSLIHPEILEDIYVQYINAGARLITTNTLGANLFKLASLREEDRQGLSAKEACKRIIRAAVATARQAVARSKKKILLFGSIGPTGDIRAYTPKTGQDNGADEFRNTFRLQAEALIEEGVEGILCETFSSLPELMIAIQAIREVSQEIPIIATMAFNKTPRGFYTDCGVTPAQMVEALSPLGITALGANCGKIGNTEQDLIINTLALAQEFQRQTNLPIIIEPNAGNPVVELALDGTCQARYNFSKEAFAKLAQKLADLKVKIIGGCCGTTPEYIRKGGNNGDSSNLGLQPPSPSHLGGVQGFSKSVGGEEASKEADDDKIREWLEQDRDVAKENAKVVKLRLKDNTFYKPLYFEGYDPRLGHDDYKEENLVEAILTPIQIEKIKQYLARGGIDPDSITIGIIRDETFISHSLDHLDAYSIVHAGTKTRIIWFGERLLKDILDNKYNRYKTREINRLFRHDITHIKNPRKADRQHRRHWYKKLSKLLKQRCYDLKTFSITCYDVLVEYLGDQNRFIGITLLASEELLQRILTLPLSKAKEEYSRFYDAVKRLAISPPKIQHEDERKSFAQIQKLEKVNIFSLRAEECSLDFLKWLINQYYEYGIFYIPPPELWDPAKLRHDGYIVQVYDDKLTVCVYTDRGKKDIFKDEQSVLEALKNFGIGKEEGYILFAKGISSREFEGCNDLAFVDSGHSHPLDYSTSYLFRSTTYLLKWFYILTDFLVSPFFRSKVKPSQQDIKSLRERNKRIRDYLSSCMTEKTHSSGSEAPPKSPPSHLGGGQGSSGMEAVKAVSEGRLERAVLIANSDVEAIEMSIASNRFSNIRAALCRNEDQAELSRKHNNSNVLVVNRALGEAAIISKWQSTAFEGGERHTRRVEKISQIEDELRRAVSGKGMTESTQPEKRIVPIASDHGGFELKSKVVEILKNMGYGVFDVGTPTKDSCDYPDYCGKAARLINDGEYAKGILICTTGIGMSIVANKFPNVRGALCLDAEQVVSARDALDFNVLVMGQKYTPLENEEVIRSMVMAFLKEKPAKPEPPAITTPEEKIAEMILGVIKADSSRIFTLDEIKAELSLDIPSSELRKILDKLCNGGKIIMVGKALQELMEFYKEHVIKKDTIEHPEGVTFMDEYTKELVYILYSPNFRVKNIAQLDKDFKQLIDKMRTSSRKISQSYIKASFTKMSIDDKYRLLFEKLTGRKVEPFKVSAYIMHKLLEYIESFQPENPSLENFANFLGMELGKLKKTDTVSVSFDKARNYLSFEQAA